MKTSTSPFARTSIGPDRRTFSWPRTGRLIVRLSPDGKELSFLVNNHSFGVSDIWSNEIRSSSGGQNGERGPRSEWHSLSGSSEPQQGGTPWDDLSANVEEPGFVSGGPDLLAKRFRPMASLAGQSNGSLSGLGWLSAIGRAVIVGLGLMDRGSPAAASPPPRRLGRKIL